MKVFSIVAAVLLVILGGARLYLLWERERERAHMTEPTEIFKARQKALIKGQMEGMGPGGTLPTGTPRGNYAFPLPPLPGLPTPKPPLPLQLRTPRTPKVTPPATPVP